MIKILACAAGQADSETEMWGTRLRRPGKAVSMPESAGPWVEHVATELGVQVAS